ncbi:hypothetical protein [Agromyces sp. NPDC058104]|uniref:hypothetical protein n=1 Tax=Agromyces sp. NPDC058104 TaxID=3346342 RepID=UPI0036DE8D98
MKFLKSIAAGSSAFLLIATIAGTTSPAYAEGSTPEFTLQAIGTALEEGLTARSGDSRLQVILAGKSSSETEGAATDLLVMRSPDGTEALVDTTLLASEDSLSHAVSAVGDGFVDLSWPDVSATGEYEVLRDGQAIATVGENSYRDVTALAGTTHHYQVSTSVTKPDELMTDAEQRAAAAGDPAPESGKIWGFEIDIPEAGVDSRALLADASAAATNSASMNVYYQTFIRPMTITADVPGSCKYTAPDKYMGDNRGFELKNFNFRTDSQILILWGAYSSPGFFQSRIYTGVTTAFTADDQFLEAGQAVPNQTAQVMGQSPSTIDFRVSFQAGDPFCYARSIAAVYNATLTRTGNYAIGGTHRGAPDHQIVLERGDYDANYNIIQKRKFIYTREQADILCLVGGLCPELQIATQGTYE